MTRYKGVLIFNKSKTREVTTPSVYSIMAVSPLSLVYLKQTHGYSLSLINRFVKSLVKIVIKPPVNLVVLIFSVLAIKPQSAVHNSSLRPNTFSVIGCLYSPQVRF